MLHEQFEQQNVANSIQKERFELKNAANTVETAASSSRMLQIAANSIWKMRGSNSKMLQRQ